MMSGGQTATMTIPLLKSNDVAVRLPLQRGRCCSLDPRWEAASHIVQRPKDVAYNHVFSMWQPVMKGSIAIIPSFCGRERQRIVGTSSEAKK